MATSGPVLQRSGLAEELDKVRSSLHAADQNVAESLDALYSVLGRDCRASAARRDEAKRAEGIKPGGGSRWGENRIHGGGEEENDKWRATARACSNTSLKTAHAVNHLLGRWSVLNLNGRPMQEILEELDVDKDGSLDQDELLLVLKQSGIQATREEVHGVWEKLAQDDGNGTRRIGVQALEGAVGKALARKQITDWLQDLRILELIANRLIDASYQHEIQRKARQGTVVESPLHHLVDLQPARLLQQLKGIDKDVEASICLGLADFATNCSSPSSQSAKGSKFAWSSSGEEREALFGDTEFFRKGLNDLIGLPDEKIAAAMEAEHTLGESSHVAFETSNYGTSTCPFTEWEFVVHPSPLKTYPGEGGPHGRRRVAVEELMRNRPCNNGHGDPSCAGCSSCLTREEVIALRLYTGPMYMFYNEVLRGLLRKANSQANRAEDDDCRPPGVSRGQKRMTKDSSFKVPGAREHSMKKINPSLKSVARENSTRVNGGIEAEQSRNRNMILGTAYRTTIHMISSGIVKLAEIMKRPPTRKLYRGLSGMRLPDRLFKEDPLGWKGAVEVAFMSCTLKRDVALQYIGDAALPILFEIETSQIDRGGSLEWCSQYPNEEEVLLPPLSNLEVNGEPKMVVIGGRTIMVFQMQLNVNLKIMKREEHEGRRKTLHLASVYNTYMELNRDLSDACQAIKQKPLVSKQKGFRQAQAISELIVHEVDELLSMQDCRSVSWYNHDRNYKTALEEVALMKEMAMAKFKWWRDSSAVKLENFNQLSMLQVMKYQASKHYHEYCALRERYSIKKFLNDENRISRDAFISVLTSIKEHVKGHEWTSELIEGLWQQLKKDGAGDDLLTIREFVGLQSLVTYDPIKGNICLTSDSNASGLTLQEELKRSALKVVEAYVDEDNLDSHYGVDQDTALITAASQGDDAEVELYLDAGARLEVCNNKGYNAIASAVCQGMDDCLEILLTAAHERGFDLKEILEKGNDGGKTPLALACSNGWADCVRILLREGADLNTTCHDGFSVVYSFALHLFFSASCATTQSLTHTRITRRADSLVLAMCLRTAVHLCMRTRAPRHCTAARRCRSQHYLLAQRETQGLDWDAFSCSPWAQARGSVSLEEGRRQTSLHETVFSLPFFDPTHRTPCTSAPTPRTIRT